MAPVEESMVELPTAEAQAVVTRGEAPAVAADLVAADSRRRPSEELPSPPDEAAAEKAAEKAEAAAAPAPASARAPAGPTPQPSPYSSRNASARRGRSSSQSMDGSSLRDSSQSESLFAAVAAYHEYRHYNEV